MDVKMTPAEIHEGNKKAYKALHRLYDFILGEDAWQERPFTLDFDKKPGKQHLGRTAGSLRKFYL